MPHKWSQARTANGDERRGRQSLAFISCSWHLGIQRTMSEADPTGSGSSFWKQKPFLCACTSLSSLETLDPPLPTFEDCPSPGKRNDYIISLPASRYNMEAIAKFDFMASGEDELSFPRWRCSEGRWHGAQESQGEFRLFWSNRGVNLTVEQLKLFLKKHKQFFQNLKFTSTKKVSSEHPCTSHQAGWWKSDWYSHYPVLRCSWSGGEIHPCAGLLIDVLILALRSTGMGQVIPPWRWGCERVAMSLSGKQ